MTDQLRDAAEAAIGAMVRAAITGHADALDGYAEALRAALAEPEAEPVAWMYDEAKYRPSDLRGQQWMPRLAKLKPFDDPEMVRGLTPLYTHPPSRAALAEQEAGQELRDWEAVAADQAMTIAMLRAQLAEPEAEPVAWGVMKRGERVWYVNDSRSVCEGYASLYAHRDANGPDQSVVPLYTAPQRREWVSLTDEEIEAAWKSCDPKRLLPSFAAAIEAALKEKNHD